MAIGYGDILLNENNEIFGINGDLATGDNREQAIGAIINANPGNFRRWPTLGAAISSELDGPLDTRNLSAKIQEAASIDGWRVDKISVEVDNLEDVKITVVSAEKITDDTESLY